MKLSLRRLQPAISQQPYATQICGTRKQATIRMDISTVDLKHLFVSLIVPLFSYDSKARVKETNAVNSCTHKYENAVVDKTCNVVTVFKNHLQLQCGPMPKVIIR